MVVMEIHALMERVVVSLPVLVDLAMVAVDRDQEAVVEVLLLEPIDQAMAVMVLDLVAEVEL